MTPGAPPDSGDGSGSRRGFLTSLARGAALTVLGGGAGALARAQPPAPDGRRTVWQIDPYKCTQCGRCATACVMPVSAVRAVNDLPRCGFCLNCFGFLRPGAPRTDSGAENLLCPTGALKRRWVEGPAFEYVVDEALCVGCGLCTAGCARFGAGSLYLQVRHDRCLACNECAIAVACPSDAFRRVPAAHPYLLESAGRPG
jgi:electron transport complex protein RnfB